MVARAAFALALVAIAVVGMASAQNSFCESRGGGYATDSTQLSWVSSIVVKAATGGGTYPITGGTSVGLFNEPNNRGYFNGTLPPYKDFINNSTNQAYLVDHLTRFFLNALGCRYASGTNPWTPVQLFALHAPMQITGTIMTAFINELLAAINSMVTSGLTTSDPNTSDLAYLSALVSQFNRWQATPSTTTFFENGFMICADSSTAANCPLARAIRQFIVNTDGTLVQLGSATFNASSSNSVAINTGDYLNFRYGVGQGITQAATATSTSALYGGISTPTATAAGTTYTTQVVQPGTYYFYNNAAASTQRITLTVSGFYPSSTGAALPPQSSSSAMSTGSASMMSSASSSSAISMMSSSSTGSSSMTGNTAASSASVGFAAVAAAVVAAIALA